MTRLSLAFVGCVRGRPKPSRVAAATIDPRMGSSRTHEPSSEKHRPHFKGCSAIQTMLTKPSRGYYTETRVTGNVAEPYGSCRHGLSYVP
ncbi:hypothetical protein LZ32DRAFT_609793 [Colletotrichum eremochloae]|nr:hypothetical protein LZ32DRAFT_609793 [Colletotrichum eremochloae]